LFYLAKLALFILEPLNLLMLMTAAGFACAALGWRRIAKGFAWTAVVFAVLMLLTPLPQVLLRGWERSTPIPDIAAQSIAGAIVLGGATAGGSIARETGQYQLNRSAERLTAIVALRRQDPTLRIVVTGGSGQIVPDAWREPEVTSLFLIDMGIDPATVTFERASRNTYENAVETAALLQGESGTWLLITSAAHMPRAAATFRAAFAGSAVRLLPYPVDYNAGPVTWAALFQQPLSRLKMATNVFREVSGYAAYWLLGRMG